MKKNTVAKAFFCAFIAGIIIHEAVHVFQFFLLGIPLTGAGVFYETPLVWGAYVKGMVALESAWLFETPAYFSDFVVALTTFKIFDMREVVQCA